MSMSIRIRPSRLPLLAILALSVGCGDLQSPVAEPAETPNAPGSPEAPPLSVVIVSNPAGSGGLAIASDELGSSIRIDIVYASLAPGTVPEGERIVIRNRATRAEVGTALINGGFDPIAIPASVGDTLDVRLYLANQTEPEESVSVVPERRPPVLVRVDPTPGRRDVPLNAVLLLVFSEPIDATSLTPSSVSLSRDGSPVAGTLAFGDPARLAVKFTPSEDLAVGTEYTFRVTPAVRDQDGEALETPVVVTFTTVESPEPVSGSLGTYDLAARVETFDPVWGVDMQGAYYTAVVALDRSSHPSLVTGSFTEWRGIFPDGEFIVEPDATGLVSGHVYPNGQVAIEVNRLLWAMQGTVLETGDISGTWGCCGHISGTFTAVRITPDD